MYPFVISVILDGLADVLSALNDLFMGIVEELLRLLESLVTQTPYPKSGGEPIFLGDPGSGVWGSMYELYQTTEEVALLLLMLMLIVISGMKIVEDYFPQWSGSNPGDIVKMMIATVIWWPIAVSLLTFSDLLAGAVLQLSSSGNVTGLVSAFRQIKENTGLGGAAANGVEGIALSLALLIPFILQAGLMILLFILWVIRYLVIFILTPVMPLAFVMSAFDMPGADPFQSLGRDILKMYVSIIFLSFPASVIIIVFGKIASQVLETFESMIGGGVGEPSSSAMTLADGAAATGQVSSLAADATTFIVGIIFMTAIPLIAAGGPWLIIGLRNGGGLSGVKSQALSSTPAGIGKDMLTRGKKVSSYAGEFSGEFGSEEGGASSSSGRSRSASSSGATSGGGTSDTSSSATESATEEATDTGFVGNMKQRMSSSMETASRIKDQTKDFKDASEAERAAMITGGALSAGEQGTELMKSATKSGVGGAQSLKDKASSEINQIRQYGVSEVARKHKHNAQTKAANAVSEGNVAIGDATEQLREKADDLSERAEENLNRNRSRIDRAKRRAAGKITEAQAEEGGFIEGLGRVAASDMKEAWRKDPIVDVEEFENSDFSTIEEYKQHKLEQSEYDSMSELRASKMGEYREENLIDRRDSGDILSERAVDEGIEGERTQARSEIEKTMKSMGVWEDYQNNDKTAEETLRDAIGYENTEINVRDLPDSVAERIGVDKELLQNADESGSFSWKNQDKIEDFIKESSLQYNSSEELEEAIRSGKKIQGKYYDPADWEENGTFQADKFVKQELADSGELDPITSEEEFREKYSSEEIKRQAELNGYESTQSYINNEIRDDIQQNKQIEDSKNTVAEQQDALANLFGVENDETKVNGQDIVDTVGEDEETIKRANRDLARVGQNADPEQMREAGIDDETIDEIYGTHGLTPEEVQSTGGPSVSHSERDELLEQELSSDDHQTREFSPEPDSETGSAIAQMLDEEAPTPSTGSDTSDTME